MNKIKDFYETHKRTIFTTIGCFVAILMIAVVASHSMNISVPATINTEETAQTSSQDVISFVMPIENGEIIKDYSSSSLKYNATLKQWEAHKGVDIKGADDASVRAAYKGEVLSVENNYLTGTVVTIRHTNGLQTVYSSLDEDVSVKIGDKVQTGQVIGKVSTTAKSEAADGPHLHFEVIENNKKVDPNLYLESSNK